LHNNIRAKSMPKPCFRIALGKAHMGGTSRPRALAVFRFMTSSNFVGACRCLRGAADIYSANSILPGCKAIVAGHPATFDMGRCASDVSTTMIGPTTKRKQGGFGGHRLTNRHPLRPTKVLSLYGKEKSMDERLTNRGSSKSPRPVAGHDGPELATTAGRHVMTN
jgi:hypothetical protein